jgi:predicted RNA-binding Zn-ribbon protein involved in translation (DUF1610 family)
MDTPTPPAEPRQPPTPPAGQNIDDGKGRIFPCEQCGADLKFSIGQQQLQCPFCGWTKAIALDETAAVVEQDYHAMLGRLVQLRAQGRTDKVAASEIRCSSCGATVVFTDTLTSTECACCGSPLQRENVHDAADRVPVDGVLPFQIEQARAATNLAEWVQSRWFAPSEFRLRGATGRFSGVYLPFWTFDTMTYTVYVGQRGEHYTVTVGTGQNKRQERRTRWHHASGQFQRFFDDVLVCAATGVPDQLLAALEPWPLEKCAPFSQPMLAGFLAQTYSVPLDQGFSQAKPRIEGALRADVHSRIGGDEQRIDSMKVRYDAISYKHLLLPVWLMAYRFREKTYRVVVNASTGEVQGERPYSWLKIFGLVVGVVAVVGAIVLFARR